MATKTPTFKLADGGKLKLTEEQRGRLLKAYDGAAAAVAELDRVRKEPTLEEAYFAWAKKMADLGMVCEALGITIVPPTELVDGQDYYLGDESGIGANGTGVSTDEWMPSSICW